MKEFYQSIKIFGKKYISLQRTYILFALILFFVYFFLVNHNPLADSYKYASSVKYGVDLFSPHHLLYNAFNYIIYSILSLNSFSIDVMRFMQFVNALFATGSFYMLYKIIFSRTENKNLSFAGVIFVASSFGVMRFGVEAETYMIPIFFSLLSSWFFLQHSKTQKIIYILLSSFFISVACLFHQIHIFWAIGLFIGLLAKKKYASSALFALILLSIPLAYVLVLVFYENQLLTFQNLLRFAADHYYSENSDAQLGLQNFLITPITFIRTFFQIHGVVLTAFKNLFFVYLIVPVVIFFLICGVRLFFKDFKVRKKNVKNVNFEKTHIIIFVLQLVFAFYAHGNSEFMVMLPFLMAIFVPIFFRIKIKTVLTISAAMLLWNISTGILPNYILDYQNNQQLTKVIYDNKDMDFIVKEKILVSYQYFYEYGEKWSPRILEMKDVREGRTISNSIYYTDLLSKKTPFSRSDIAQKDNLTDLVFIGHFKHIESDNGGFYIDKVEYTGKKE